MKQYLYDLIFHKESADPIRGPEKDNITKHEGRFISIGALRNQLLNNIDDVIELLTAPAGEGVRSVLSQARIEAASNDAKDSQGERQGDKNTYIPLWRREVEASKKSESQMLEEEKTPKVQDGKHPGGWRANPNLLSAEERLKAIPPPSKRQMEMLAAFAGPSRDENVKAWSSTAQSPWGQDQGVKDAPVTSGPPGWSEYIQEQVDLLPDHLRNSSPNHEDDSAQTIVEPSVESKEQKMKGNQPFGMGSLMHVSEGVGGEDSPAQHGSQPFAYAIPSQNMQQNPMGAMPPGLFYPIGFGGPAQQGSGVQQNHQFMYRPSGTFQQPSFAMSQPMQYGPQPMQYAYPQQNVNFAASSAGYGGFPSGYALPPAADTTFENRGMTKSPSYNPTPMPYPNTVARPPSSNRVASLLYRNNTPLQTQQLEQVRGTPPPARNFVQNHSEWQNRFGLPSVVKPDIPLLPYRPETDDMRPNSMGGASFQYQELTRDDLPSFDTARAPENLPFTETAKDSKPSQWGVMKIGNVSISNDSNASARRVPKDLGRFKS